MINSVAIFRADGNATIGMGHIMRCIGLAQGLRAAGFNVVFALGQSSKAVIDRLVYEKFDFRVLEVSIGSNDDCLSTIDICNELASSLLIVDGYNFGGKWLRRIKSGRQKQVTMLWTDYVQDEHLPVDIILDQTPYAIESDYSKVCRDALVLCGLQYSVLRTEFIDNIEIRHNRSSIENIIVMMGGADPTSSTQKVLQALEVISSYVTIRVVVGPANKNIDDITAFVRSRKSYEVVSSVNDMSNHLTWADIAISAAGTTMWECAYSGLPVIAISIAANQSMLAKAIGDYNCGINLGADGDVTGDDILSAVIAVMSEPFRLRDMSKNTLSLIDGRGVERVVKAIEGVIEANLYQKHICE